MPILRKDVNEILMKIKKGDEDSKNALFEKTYNHLKRVAVYYKNIPCGIEKWWICDFGKTGRLRRSLEHWGWGKSNVHKRISKILKEI